MELSRVRMLSRLYEEEISEAISGVISSSDFINGRDVSLLEQELKTFSGASYVSSCGSGSDALFLSLLSIGVGTGDEVITTSFSFVATAEAILRVGAVPVFVDINPDDFNIDASLITSRITNRTKAILPVELFGTPVCSRIFDIAVENDLFLVIDGAQSFRRNFMWHHPKVIGITSFFPTKILGCYGDGGAVFCNDENLFKRINMLKNHGMVSRYNSHSCGLLSRLDTIQAAILRVKIKYLEEEIQARRTVAEGYLSHRDKLATMGITLPLFGSGNVFSQFTILCQERDSVVRRLKSNGVPCAIYYPSILPTQSLFSPYVSNTEEFPVASLSSSRVLSLPMDVNPTEIESVVDTILGYQVPDR